MNKVPVAIGIVLVIAASIAGIYAIYQPSDFSEKSDETSQTPGKVSLQDDVEVSVEKTEESKTQETPGQFSLKDKVEVSIEQQETQEQNSTEKKQIFINITDSFSLSNP